MESRCRVSSHPLQHMSRFLSKKSNDAGVNRAGKNRKESYDSTCFRLCAAGACFESGFGLGTWRSPTGEVDKAVQVCASVCEMVRCVTAPGSCFMSFGRSATRRVVHWHLRLDTYVHYKSSPQTRVVHICWPLRGARPCYVRDPFYLEVSQLLSNQR